MTRTWLGLLAALVLGCRAEEPVVIPKFAEQPRPYEPQAGSGNAFDGYMLAGLRALELAPDEAGRVSFGPQQRERLRTRLRPALEALESAARLPCRYEFWARTSPEPHEYEVGLRLLGRALTWSVEAAVGAGDHPTAVRWTLLAHRVGFDLLGGDAMSATLGTAFLDESRAALAPSLAGIPPAQLRRLTEGLARVLAAAPAADQALRHEMDNMLMGVQTVADHYRSRTLDTLLEELGRGVRPAVGYLKGLDDRKALDFLVGFRDEAVNRTTLTLELATTPARDRQVPPLSEAGRPWKRFASHYFSGLDVLLTLRDRAVARTKLLAVTAWARASVASGGAAPPSLDGLDPILRADPFTGEEFRYTASGPEFKVYSVGADGRDDGGASDDSGLEPDVVLEGSW